LINPNNGRISGIRPMSVFSEEKTLDIRTLLTSIKPQVLISLEYIKAEKNKFQEQCYIIKIQMTRYDLQ
jgi:hypothetical protein